MKSRGTCLGGPVSAYLADGEVKDLHLEENAIKRAF